MRQADCGDPAASHAGSRGISLLVAECGMPGFARGRKLDKIGLHDTAGLFFDDVRVPAANLPGREGGGFVHLMERLPPGRLSIAMMALAPVRAALDWTVDYVTQRTASGRPWPRSRTPSSSWPPR
jgi:alkylation response protein AidB-like acyl-CoA dehydrogenase